MTAKASTSYVADLPDLTPEQLEKLHTWGRTCCKFDVHMEGDALKLVTVRKKAATAREHMRLASLGSRYARKTTRLAPTHIWG